MSFVLPPLKWSVKTGVYVIAGFYLLADAHNHTPTLSLIMFLVSVLFLTIGVGLLAHVLK